MKISSEEHLEDYIWIHLDINLQNNSTNIRDPVSDGIFSNVTEKVLSRQIGSMYK